jgi:hypothetical protein
MGMHNFGRLNIEWNKALHAPKVDRFA